MKRLLILLLFITLSASAQEPLSLNECINQAIQNSEQLKINSKASAVLYSALEIVKTEYLPSLSATASGDINTNNLQNSTLRNYGYDIGLTLQQSLWQGGRINSAKRAAQLQITIQDESNERALQSVEYLATTHYWNLAAYQRYLDIANQYLRDVELLYDIVETRYRDGYVSKSDLLMIQTHLNEAQQGVIVANRLCNNALYALNQTLGNVQVVPYELLDTLSTPTDNPSSLNFDEVLSHRADYQSTRSALRLAQENINVTKSLFNPQLWLTLNSSYGTPIPNLISDKIDLYGVAAVSFSATIFEFGKRHKSVAQAKGRVAIAELNILELEQTIFEELQSAVNDLEHNYRECRLWEENLNTAQENLMLSIYRYEQGAIPMLDVLSAQIMWLTSYRAQVGAVWNYAISLATLEYVSGEY